MQPLIQGFQGQRPSPFGLGTCSTAAAASAVGVHDARQSALRARTRLVVASFNVLVREGGARIE